MGSSSSRRLPPLLRSLARWTRFPLASGKVADLLLLVRTLEVEARHVGPRRDLAFAQGDLIDAPGDLLEDRVLGAERVARLIDVGRDHAVPDPQFAPFGRLLAHDHAEQGRLAGAVGTDHADDPSGGQAERHVLEQETIAVALLHAHGLDHEVAQVGTRGDLEDHGLVAAVGFLRRHLLVSLQPGAVLGDPGSGGQPDPFQLALEGLAAVALGLLLLREPIFLLFQPARIIPLPGDALAAIEFQDPAGHVVQEVAIVGHGHDGAGILVEVAFEPGHALGVQVVRGLVQEEHVGLLEQELAEGHATLLAAGEDLHVGVAGGQPHGVHRDFELAVEIPGVRGLDLVLDRGLLVQELLHLVRFEGLAEAGVDGIVAIEEGFRGGHGLHHVAQDILRGVELGLLREVADPRARGGPGGPDEVLLHAGHDPQERALARAVAPQDADLGPGIERQPDILEHLFFAVGLGQVLDREDVLRRHGLRARGTGGSRGDEGRPQGLPLERIDPSERKATRSSRSRSRSRSPSARASQVREATQDRSARTSRGRLRPMNPISAAIDKTEELLGHSPHTAIVSLPLGAWAFSNLCDGLAMLTGERKYDDAARLSMAVGLVGAAGAVLTGLNDYAKIPKDRPSHEVATTHALGNSAVASMFVASYVMRGKRSRPGTPRQHGVATPGDHRRGIVPLHRLARRQARLRDGREREAGHGTTLERGEPGRNQPGGRGKRPRPRSPRPGRPPRAECLRSSAHRRSDERLSGKRIRGRSRSDDRG